MTRAEFKTLIATLESQGLSVTAWCGLADNLPRLVWGESHFEYDWSDDHAGERRTSAWVDFFTKTQDDPLLETFIAACVSAELPMECDVAYDENDDVITYAFRIHLDEPVG